MKRINLKHYTAPDPESIYTAHGYYHVYLGNGYKQQFTSEKKALKFLADANRFLNEKMYQLNFRYIDVMTEYRKAWLYFSSHKRHTVLSLSDIDRQSQLLMSNITRQFDIMESRSSWIIGNTLVFQCFNRIVADLNSILDLLFKLYSSKSEGLNKHRVSDLKWILEKLQLEMNTYPNQ